MVKFDVIIAPLYLFYFIVFLLLFFVLMIFFGRWFSDQNILFIASDRFVVGLIIRIYLILICDIVTKNTFE